MPGFIGLSVEVDGVERVRGAYASLASAFGDFSPFFESEGTRFRSRMAEHFYSFGGMVGGWKPLSPGYAAWKAEQRPGRPIMVFDGDLRRSFLGVGSTGNVTRIYKDRAEFGSSNPVAAIHQYGGGDVPARPLVVMNAKDNAALGRRFGSFINALVSSSFKPSGTADKRLRG